jgi:regulator of protease activity HflC (stomatin/prohibitin superfamily)
MASIRTRNALTINGFLALLLFLAAAGYAAWRAYEIANGALRAEDLIATWQPVTIGLLLFISLGGFFVVQPNEARVLVFFGRYVGSVTDAGFFFANPLAARHTVSLRVHNFNSDKLKVNEARGNPIEIAAVIVWRVTDTARALLDVENYKGFVAVQCETAIRSVAMRFPYDSHVDGEASLRGNPDEVSAALKSEVQARLDVAGLEILEARLSHLAYAPEIAQSMLRRQQAEAIVAAPADRRGRGRHGRDGPAPARGHRRRHARRGAQGGDGQQPAGRAGRRPRGPAGDQHRVASTEGAMAEKKRFLLRLEPELYAALERWSADELRSVNGQIEFLLKEAARHQRTAAAPGGEQASRSPGAAALKPKHHDKEARPSSDERASVRGRRSADQPITRLP